jgi:hypothetical protein
VNPLQELLEGEEGLLDVDRVREATATSLHSLRHDRRVERLDREETLTLSAQLFLFHTPDVRTLARNTVPTIPEEIEEAIERERGHVNRLLFEVVHVGSLEDEGIRRLQRVGVARGSQVRVTEVPFRLHLYNRAFAMVAADFDRSKAGALAVREPDLLASLTLLHARYWQQGDKWEDGGRSGVDLAEVLAELLAGGTDESSAQHLHVSLRTYRRKVQELLELLGVQSRFQAGAVAEQRRYLDLVRRGTRPLAATPNPYVEALLRVRSPEG